MSNTMTYIAFHQQFWILLTVYLISHGAHISPEKAIVLNPIVLGAKIPRIVLTIDVSESMESQQRIYKLRDALRFWIKYLVPDGHKLAIVKFSSSPSLMNNLVVINESSREHLIESIPTLAQGETCISCGLALAMEVLGNKTAGSVIILITDVEESEPSQDVRDMFDKIKVTDTRIVTISIGSGVMLDYIEELAKISGGLAYSVNDGEEVYNEVMKALSDTLDLFHVNEIDSSIINSMEANTTMTTVKIELQESTVERDTFTTTKLIEDVQQITNLSSLQVLHTTHSSTKVETHISVTEISEALPVWVLFLIGVLTVLILLILIFVVAAICLRKRYKIINIQGSYQLSKLLNK